MAKRAPATRTSSAPIEDPVYESIEQVNPQERAFVKALLRRIENAASRRAQFDNEILPKLRRLTYGIQAASPTNGQEPLASDSAISSVRTNMIFATAATLLPHIYARNPEIAVTPTESVGDGEYDQIKGFAETAQAMLNRCFVEEGHLKKRMKANIRSTMTTSVGWLKMSFQESYVGDPMIVRRVNDLQDNVARLEASGVEVQSATDVDKRNQLLEQMKQQRATLLESNELRLYKGFVLDRASTEDVLILDDDCREFDDYAEAGEIAMRVFMCDSEYRARYGRKPWKGARSFPAATIHKADSDDPGSHGRKAGESKGEAWRCVWEVWSRRDGRVYTVCEGAEAYVRPPFAPSCAPKRWHSMYCLGFNIVEGRWRPLSDVELLANLQDEYNTTRFLYAEARKEAIPVRIFRKGGELTDEDIENLANRKARRFIGVSGNPTVPINADIMQLDGVKIDPNAYDVTLIRNDMDLMIGLSDASRANLIQAKTATEAQIMAQSLANRVAERQDAIEDLVSEMAEAALQTMMQKFTAMEVTQIVGEGAVWPEDAGPELWHKIRVKVRAGSSGKPNQAKEREDWAQIAPVINETMMKVAELRAAGQVDMANCVIELARETLRRFDERIDIDRFIPREAGQNDEVDVAQMQQQLQEAQMMAQQLQEQLLLAQEELAKAQQQEQFKLEELATKRAAEEQKAADDAAVRVEQERAKAAEAQAKGAIEEARARADAETAQQMALMKAAVDLITKLGIVPGTHGITGSMGELIDSASMAIQGVMDGTAQLAAGGRPAPEAEDDDAGESESENKPSKSKGKPSAEGRRKTVKITRPDGQVYTATIEEG